MKDKRKTVAAVEAAAARLEALDGDPVVRMRALKPEQRRALIRNLTSRLNRASPTWIAWCAELGKDPATWGADMGEST